MIMLDVLLEWSTTQDESRCAASLDDLNEFTMVINRLAQTVFIIQNQRKIVVAMPAGLVQSLVATLTIVRLAEQQQ